MELNKTERYKESVPNEKWVEKSQAYFDVHFTEI